MFFDMLAGVGAFEAALIYFQRRLLAMPCHLHSQTRTDANNNTKYKRSDMSRRVFSLPTTSVYHEEHHTYFDRNMNTLAKRIAMKMVCLHLTKNMFIILLVSN